MRNTSLISPCPSKFNLFFLLLHFVLLGCTQLRYKHILLKKRIKLTKHVFNTSIRLKYLDMFIQLIFQFHLEFMKFILRHWISYALVNICKSRVIISKCDVVLICLENLQIIDTCYLTT